MTRLLLQLVNRIGPGCGLLIVIALTIGRMLPAEPELMFTVSYNLSDLNIYRLSLSRHMSMAVTHHPANDFMPDWSPDGEQVAFVSDRDGHYSIYTANAQGLHSQRLIQTAEDVNQYNPVWSPDGRYIAYIDEQKGYGQIMLYDLTTHTTQQLTDSYRTHVSPVWSPDGQNITFVSDLDERWNTKIYSINIETRIISPILVGSATNPVWSPDGRYLLYISGYEKSNLFLWDNGLGQSTLLYDGDFINSDTPAWSADGRTIVFSAFTTNGNSGIFQIPVDACLARSPECIPQELTDIPAFYRNPRWKPTQSNSSQ
ncbi:MAG: hypothetical protein GC179_10680 [Anaerolineaceae bacterium]|nr:hypothetical protein [Anaerolineaceae bacterium]